MVGFRLCLPLVVCAAVQGVALAQPIRLAANLTTAPIGSNPFPLVRLGDRVVFGATTADRGRELFATDGTPAGTSLIADLNPGPASSLAFYTPDSALQLFTVVSDRIFFAADDGIHGVELWVTDGTFGGTRLVKDIKPGPGSSYPRGVFVDAAGVLFFTADDTTHGYEPWRTDGTEAGTTMVADVTPNVDSSKARVVAEDLTGFYLVSTSRGMVWRKNFDSDELVVLKDYGPSDEQLFFFNNSLLFTAYTTQNGTELWRSDGTVMGTTLVGDLNPGSADSFPMFFTPFNGRVFFTAITTGTSLASTDGATAAPVTGGWSARTQRIHGVFGNRLILQVGDTTGRRPQLWLTDGTSGGTQSFASSWIFRPSDGGPYENYGPSVIADGTSVFYMGTTGTVQPPGPQLFKVTPPSTVITPVTSATGPGPAKVQNFTLLNGRVIAAATDALGQTELWASDVPGGLASSQIADLNASDSNTSLAWLRPLGSRLIFLLNAGGVGVTPRLATTNGNPSSLVLGDTVRPDVVSELPSFTPAVLGNQLYFENRTAANGLELWTSDGTTAAGATHIVRDITVGTGSTSLTNLTTAGSLIYFFVNDVVPVLWRTDGTSAGTIALTPVNGAFGNITPFHDSTVLLTGRANAADPPGIWISDGTVAGTTRVKGFNSLSIGGTPITVVEGANVAFFASGPFVTEGRELWRTDGTEGGTVLVRDIVLGSGSSAPSQIVSAGVDAMGRPRIFFVATTAGEGAELWFSDGTADGTVMVKDIRTGPLWSSISQLRAVPGVTPKVFFVADDGVHGARLWTSDGTEGGTTALPDIHPIDYDGIGNLTIARGRAYFTVDDGQHGVELWTSDGTAGGTHIVQDLWPGLSSGLAVSDVTITGGLTPEITLVNSRLFFIANNGVSGQKIHYLDLCPTDLDNSGAATLQDVFDYLGAFFAGDLRADFDSSGMVTLQDLFDFLAAWFAGC